MLFLDLQQWFDVPIHCKMIIIISLVTTCYLNKDDTVLLTIFPMLCISSYDLFIPTCVFHSNQTPLRLIISCLGPHLPTSEPLLLPGDVFTGTYWTAKQSGDPFAQMARLMLFVRCLQTTAPLQASGGTLNGREGNEVVARVPCISTAWPTCSLVVLD